jgi:hypothetical protein
MELLLIFGMVLVSSVWVGVDASQLGIRKGLVKGVADIGPAGWLFGCLFLWIIAFPLYLAKRSELKRLASIRTGPLPAPIPPRRSVSSPVTKAVCPACGELTDYGHAVRPGDPLSCSCGNTWMYSLRIGR